MGVKARLFVFDGYDDFILVDDVLFAQQFTDQVRVGRFRVEQVHAVLQSIALFGQGHNLGLTLIEQLRILAPCEQAVGPAIAIPVRNSSSSSAPPCLS